MLATMHQRAAGVKPASQDMESLQVQFYDTNELVQAQATAEAAFFYSSCPCCVLGCSPGTTDTHFGGIVHSLPWHLALALKCSSPCNSWRRAEDEGISIIIELTKLGKKPASPLCLQEVFRKASLPLLHLSGAAWEEINSLWQMIIFKLVD